MGVLEKVSSRFFKFMENGLDKGHFRSESSCF